MHRDAIFTEYYEINNPGPIGLKGLGLALLRPSGCRILPEHSMRFWSVEGRGSCFSLYGANTRNDACCQTVIEKTTRARRP